MKSNVVTPTNELPIRPIRVFGLVQIKMKSIERHLGFVEHLIGAIAVRCLLLVERHGNVYVRIIDSPLKYWPGQYFNNLIRSLNLEAFQVSLSLTGTIASNQRRILENLDLWNIILHALPQPLHDCCIIPCNAATISGLCT